MNGIEIKDLEVEIGHFKLKNINLDVKKGSILGLVGRNGAGKTTLIKTIANCYKIKAGQIRVNGLSKESNILEYTRILGLVYDDLSVNRYLKPKVIMKILSKNFSHFDQEFMIELMNRFNIDPNQRLINNSLGTNKKFSIILALSLKPEVLLLDEPTSGIDPADKKEIIELLQTFMEDESHTILYSTHIISDLEKIADNIALIEDGKIIFNNDKEALLESLYLVQIKSNQLNNEIKEGLSYLKEDTFGFEGLTKNKDIIDKYNLSYVKPSIEQILVRYMQMYKNGGQAK